MALIRLVREVRQVRSSTDVLIAQPSSMTFYGVNDSLVGISWDPPSRRVALQRGSSTWTVAADADSFALSYFKEDGTPAAPLVSPDVTDVFRVGIYVRLKRRTTAVALETATYLRNM